MATAVPVPLDNTTHNAWNGVYGTIAHYKMEMDTPNSGNGAPVHLASTVPVGWTIENLNNIVYNGGTVAPPLGVNRADGTYSENALWYGGGVGVDIPVIHVAPGDSTVRRVRIAVYDFDNSRVMTFAVADHATGTQIPGTAQTLTNPNPAVYLGWDVSGDIDITWNIVSGANAVVQGVFFDPATQPLDGGTVTGSSLDVNLTAGAATGGTGGPYTYQWYGSQSSGFVPGAGNLLAGQTGQDLAAYTPADITAPWYFVRRASDGTSTADTPQYTVTFGTGSGVPRIGRSLIG